MFDWLQYDETVKKELANQGKQLNRFLSEYIELNNKIREMKIYDVPDEKTIQKIQGIEIPAKGRNSLEVGNELVEDVYKKGMLVQHPRFFSFVTCAVSPYSLAGSILSDIFNLHGGSYMEAPGACVIEEKVIDWMAAHAGYPKETRGGLFVSGGSMANMSAMVAARDAKLKPEEYAKARIYCSNQTHSSNEKGLRIIGFQQSQIVKINVDENFEIRIDELEEAIKKDIEEGYKPFALIGNLGTTNTGSVDPFDKMGQIAKKYNLWFHVDGALGGSLLISDLYKNRARGIELSDSLSWDSHKWLMQVYSCSSLVVKDKQNLLNSFTEHPEYLADVSSNDHLDGWDMGPEMSRPHRVLKFWYTLQATGTDLLTELVDYSCYNAILVEKELKKRKNWEVISRPSCGVITFRYHMDNYSEEELNRLNHLISEKLIETGYAYIVTTTLNNKTVLRMCTHNCNTTKEDITSTIELLDEIAQNLIAQ